MIIHDYIYQDGDYWIYKQGNVFVICKDDREKKYADVVACCDSYTRAKEIIEEKRAGGVK